MIHAKRRSWHPKTVKLNTFFPNLTFKNRYITSENGSIGRLFVTTPLSEIGKKLGIMLKYTPTFKVLSAPLYIIIIIVTRDICFCGMCNVKRALYTIQCTLYSIHCTLYNIHYTVHSIHHNLYIVYSIHYIQYTLIAIYNIHYTLCNIQYTVYDIYYALYYAIHHTVYILVMYNYGAMYSLRFWCFLNSEFSLSRFVS